MTTNWPHAPLHLLSRQGVYMVTAGTFLKEHFFKGDENLSLLQDALLSISSSFGWELHAWAVFSNHYHFIGCSPSDPSNLRTWLAKLHQNTAAQINERHQALGRRVWYQFWDTQITWQTSYFARLNYVHNNPVKHRLVNQASQYPWCSAHKFEQNAGKSFVSSVYSFDASKVKVFDEF